MNLLRRTSNYSHRISIIFGILVLGLPCACWSESLQTTSECVFQPCSELNLYKEEVVYRVLNAQNALKYGTNREFHSYDPSRLRKQLDDLFIDPTHGQEEWWEVFQARFKKFWVALPSVEGELDESEWINRNSDLMCAAYAFEILPYELRTRLFPVIPDLIEEKEELRGFWKEHRTLLPDLLEHPRVSQVRAVALPESSWKTRLQQRSTLIIAHRGGFSPFPENSFEAIRSAYLAGSDGIECDLRLTADENVVILHDEDLYSLTHQAVRTSQLTLDAVMRLRLRDPFQLSRLSSHPPLTLKTLFEQFGGKFLLWLELKPDGGTELPTRVGEMIEEYHLEDSVIVSSLSPAMVEPFRDRFKDLKVAFEFNRVNAEQMLFIEELVAAEDANRIIISCEEFQDDKQSFLNRLQEKSILTSTFTPNRFDALAHSIRAGINIIQTDRPERARALLGEIDPF